MENKAVNKNSFLFYLDAVFISHFSLCPMPLFRDAGLIPFWTQKDPCFEIGTRVALCPCGDFYLGSLRSLCLMLFPTFIAGKIHTPMEYKGELTSYDMRLRCVVEGSGERGAGGTDTC